MSIILSSAWHTRFVPSGRDGLTFQSPGAGYKEPSRVIITISVSLSSSPLRLWGFVWIPRAVVETLEGLKVSLKLCKAKVKGQKMAIARGQYSGDVYFPERLRFRGDVYQPLSLSLPDSHI